VNTGSFSEGDTLYVGATAGALVSTPPTGESAKLQNIGRVVRSDSESGVIFVGGAGRTAATPNLDQGKIFIGNASNQSSSSVYTLPITDGNAGDVLTTDGAGAVTFSPPSGGGASEQIKQVNSNYTVTTTDIEDGVRILYTGTADVWYVTLPDPSSLLSSASTVGGAAVDAVSVQVGRDRTGDTNLSTTLGVGLLNDGSTGGISGNRTTRGGEWIRAVGFLNNATNNPDWLVEDTNDTNNWQYEARTNGAYLTPAYYYACNGTFSMIARSSYFSHGQRVLVKNVGTGTITISAYSGSTVNGQASMTLSAGEYVELMGNPTTSNFEIFNQKYDASDLVAPRTGSNYTAANTDSITTHLAGIDTELNNRADTVNSVAVSNGAVTIDGDDIIAPRTATNYTGANTDSITTHLAGIDTALGNTGESFTTLSADIAEASFTAQNYRTLATNATAYTINLLTTANYLSQALALDGEIFTIENVGTEIINLSVSDARLYSGGVNYYTHMRHSGDYDFAGIGDHNSTSAIVYQIKPFHRVQVQCAVTHDTSSIKRLTYNIIPIGGPLFPFVIEEINSATTDLKTNYLYLCDTTSGAFTVTLQDGGDIGSGERIDIKNIGANTLTIDGFSTQTIDGSTSITLSQYGKATLFCAGNKWFTI
jgi:hypothetical protein